MSKATFTFGRFNPPTEAGHGKLVNAVTSHAEKTGGAHYIFPSHTQDRAKNPLSHEDKAHAMGKMFKGVNVVSDKSVVSPIHAIQHLQRQGHTHVTMIVGSGRVDHMKKLLHDYNGKEYNMKHIEVKSAGHRDPDAEGASGMSAPKLRNLVASGKRDEFISHYSDKKLGAKLHDEIKATMSESRAMFILGGPGSGKDYVINNILSRFNLIEVQLDQILTGSANELIESGENILINAPSDMEKIALVRATLGENYHYGYTVVSVTNKVSRERNMAREKPMNESVRIRKWLDAENAINLSENMFVFKNSINLNEASGQELEEFKVQIAEYLQFLIDNGLTMEGTGEENLIDTKPSLLGIVKNGKKKKPVVPPNNINSRIDGAGGYTIGGLTQTSSVYSEETEEMKSFKQFVAEEKPGLWANIRAKRERIKRGSGERMRKPGSPGAPTAQNFKDAANESVEDVSEATYKGKKVPLNKPMKGDVKKSKVYVDPDGDGKAKKVNFGDKKLSIKKHIPARKKSYCARSGGQGNTTDKTKANYWSRRAWKC